MHRKQYIETFLAGIMLICAVSSVWASGWEDNVFELADPSYFEALSEWESKGFGPTTGVDIVLPASAFVDSGGETFEVRKGIGENPAPVLLWQKEESWLEYEVEVPAAGLYNIEIKYYPLPGKRSPIQRELRINGKYPFLEAKRLMFQRFWVDAHEPKQDNQGHDLRPGQVENPVWSVKVFEDADGRYEEPLLFLLEKGVNRLRLTSIKEPMAVEWVRITSPKKIPTYAEVAREYREKGYHEVSDVAVKIQAEAPLLKTDPTIRREFGSDPLSEPREPRKMKLNEFGGWRWRKGGQAVTWKFTVPESGLYKIAFRTLAYFIQLPVHRTIYIDGVVPFREMQAYPIPYDRDWQLVTLASEEGEPFLFYLTEGEHTLTMDVKVGPKAQTIRVLEEIQREMSRVARQVVMLTGSNPDPNMQWDLAYQLPNVVPTLAECREALRREAAFLDSMCEYRPNVVNSLLMSADQLDSMAENPDSIPMRLEQFSSTQSSLGTWGLTLLEQAMTMDYIIVASPDYEWPRARATAWEKFTLGVDNFIMSFTRNYDGVGSIHEEGAGERVIDVWIRRGKSWAEIIKEMAEDSFTPQTGIKVNVLVMAEQAEMSTLLFSAVAGKAPDVALGVNANLPVQFAIRDGVANLNQFSDYPEVAKRFRPGALIPFRYQGGDFALPENQDFSMLFYRVDILQELGLEPPETWEDVYYMLAVLHQNGLDFFYPSPTGIPGQPPSMSGLTPFLFQNGGSYYTEDGLYSALDTPEALAGFKEWTELYTNYRIPIYADFYNRMRTGEMPIGVANYWQYVLLSTAAPELTGWWRMVPMPGHRKPDGTVDRTNGGQSQAAIILEQSEDKEGAWEFLKWWTSAEVQARFGTELEALLGVEARWNTANVEALKMLPWPQSDINAILEQWEWFKEVPVVLGGYYTTRHVINAWNRVVLQGWNPREALEEAVKDINRELAKKQEEFGITAPDRERGGAGR